VIDDFSVFKEEVKARVDIVEIVGEYVELKRRSSNYVGLCPFHIEKTPSFSVNPAGQFYHCFGCGKGGDVIGFLMDITGMSFIETMEQLAARVGMEMPKRTSIDPSLRDRKDQIIAANLAAGEYFHLTLSAEEGKEAMAYLTGRGLTPETIWTFRLCFAPGNTAGLVAFAKKKGVSESALEAAGIVMPGKFGRPPYGRFGGRVIFPIIDQGVRIIGFGGRLLAGEGAKYVNSPETMVYHKSTSLFGIHQAKDAIKRSRRAIVVEGYMDVISLHQAGITNVIAASGTSFTVEQGRLIARMSREAVLLFDGDSAGLSAAARGADNLLATDLAIGVVVLPEGHDPDSFVREKGSDELRKLLDAPVDLWEFKLRVFGGEAPTVEDRIRLAGEIADSIALIEDDLKRDVYIGEMAARIGVDKIAMFKAVSGRMRRRARRREEQPENSGDIVSANDRSVLSSMIAYPILARRFMEEAGSKAFGNPTVRTVADELFHRIVEGLDTSPSGLMSGLKDRRCQELVSAVGMVETDEDTATRLVEDTIKAYLKDEIRQKIKALNVRIKHEQDMGQKKQQNEKLLKLQEKLRELDSPKA